MEFPYYMTHYRDIGGFTDKRNLTPTPYSGPIFHTPKRIRICSSSDAYCAPRQTLSFAILSIIGFFFVSFGGFLTIL